MRSHSVGRVSQLGARLQPNGSCDFLVWAPRCKQVDIRILETKDAVIPMTRLDRGYFTANVPDTSAGARYFYRLNGTSELPDPASRSQPDGVHQASEVTDPEFEWTDGNWFGIALSQYVIYELHPGTFTPEGTFDAIIPHLPGLRELGITAIELMPVAQFPGNRNWGYDGVYPYAVQNSYGGGAGLKRLVNACHAAGLAVVLDVVYNHLGPEGNYLGAYAPYFTGRYKTPWGEALNFDGADSDEVRRYFIENALQWQDEFHLDALRLDAVHAIRDFSAIPFLEELVDRTRERSELLNRRFHLIAESDMNMARHILPQQLGGYGLHAQWSDDFHHAIHSLVTGERTGYYEDFGGVLPLAKAWKQGYTYTGEYSVHRRHRHGSSSANTSLKQFVVCCQNHDQVGNRKLGERLGALTTFEGQKLAAGAVILSACIPMLFMGEEYGDPAPFHYFISHSDPGLIQAVRKGRIEEFAAFAWKGDVKDPQDEATFNSCKLNHALAADGRHRQLREFYRELLRLRRELPAIAQADRHSIEMQVSENEHTLWIRYPEPGNEVAVLLNFSEKPAPIALPLAAGPWTRQIDSADLCWAGPGSQVSQQFESEGRVELVLQPRSVVVLIQP
ncbi:MAG: malto-oligosyltrehalose trehalohydrolase [Verrucomicrobia bacterium]|nr:malto-oligosyltrehalose trehalohydrolase [Verrucomicrobiota bacterium]